MPGTPRKPAGKPTARRPADPRGTSPDTARPQPQATLPDSRWQRTVRYNWDKGGSRGGRR